MKGKAAILLEYLWLLIATVSFGAGIRQWYTNTIENTWVFFAMLAVSLLMYTFRRRLRKSSKDNIDR